MVPMVLKVEKQNEQKSNKRMKPHFQAITLIIFFVRVLTCVPQCSPQLSGRPFFPLSSNIIGNIEFEFVFGICLSCNREQFIP